ncbi:unnamed protein product [Ambrosiozyma monospora]|uniref:Unnamed protein product n=1 Tax=Ambrosiozyma monospora TaxID=43982 RepID=A0A9W6Z0L3_AMBMO|nr:unnamed protein product [Ambrosiozyma monospora]
MYGSGRNPGVKDPGVPRDPPNSGLSGQNSFKAPLTSKTDLSDDLALNSALSERTTQPFSAFKTPFLNTSRWNNVEKLGEVFGFNEYNEMEEMGGETLAERGIADVYESYYDPYPAWRNEEVPITRIRIEAIFIHLTKLFGFQFDNAKNMYDYLMRLLDSRASRMSPTSALKSLHADYIGAWDW